MNSFSLICTYDPAGNQTAVYRGREKAGKKQAAQSLTYDAQGNITGVEDGNGSQTEFVLDDWGRIREIHTLEGGAERYIYDYAGNITDTTDANGEPSRTAITVWDRYIKSPIRRVTASTFTAMRKAAGRHILTGMER